MKTASGGFMEVIHLPWPPGRRGSAAGGGWRVAWAPWVVGGGAAGGTASQARGGGRGGTASAGRGLVEGGGAASRRRGGSAYPVGWRSPASQEPVRPSRPAAAACGRHVGPTGQCQTASSRSARNSDTGSTSIVRSARSADQTVEGGTKASPCI
jgi:hypothetical protein